jgi:hypothetical protein
MVRNRLAELFDETSMKYFTADIWAGWQGDEAKANRAVKKWNANLARYKTSLRRIACRLGPLQRKFFTKHSLHDGRLLLFAVSDWPHSNLKRKLMISETSVQMAVLAGTNRATIYRLQYGGIKEILVQTKNDLFPMDSSKFGDWGYDELLAEGRHFFRHNILFQTGTEISVVFQRFSFKTELASVGKLKHYVGL